MRDGLFETDFWRKNSSQDGFLVAVKTRLLNPYPRTSIYTKGCNLTKLQITTYKTLQNSTSTTKKFKIDNYFFAIFDHVN